jgi:hypothetical protein
MASWTKDGYPNLEAPYLIPETFRIQHKLMMRSFDKVFTPVLSEILPLTQAPDGGAQSFDWPITTSQKPMARTYDADEPTRYLGAPAVKEERFNTIITKAGFIRRFDEFERDFTNNLIALKYQVLAKEMIESIQKRIEFEVANVLYMNMTAIRQYSPNQDTSRGLVANIADGKFYQTDKSTEITDLGSMMSGAQWHKGGDPFRDIAAIKRAHEDMKGTPLSKGFIGAETAMWLDFNPTVIERLKYVKDTTDGVLGVSLMGMTFKKVIGNNLKEGTTYTPGQSPPFGYPGLGDLDYDKWTDRNKVPIMVDGGTTGREWAIFSENTSGRIFCSYVHKLHQRQAGSAIEPFVYEFAEQDPFRVKIRTVRMLAPVVEDFANYVLVLNTVNRSNR